MDTGVQVSVLAPSFNSFGHTPSGTAGTDLVFNTTKKDFLLTVKMSKGYIIHG